MNNIKWTVIIYTQGTNTRNSNSTLSSYFDLTTQQMTFKPGWLYIAHTPELLWKKIKNKQQQQKKHQKNPHKKPTQKKPHNQDFSWVKHNNPKKKSDGKMIYERVTSS